MSLSRRSIRIPAYKENAVLQLVVATGTGYILYRLACVTLIVFGQSFAESERLVIPKIMLAPLHDFLHRPWTLLTYGWVHDGFFEWLSTAIWMYTFGTVVQQLTGFKQVIPTFIYGLIGGGIVCLLAQLIPVHFTQPVAVAFIKGQPTHAIMTSQAGVMALMAAAITLAPRYRFYFGEDFSIPIWIVVVLYLVLNLGVYAAGNPAMLALALGGAATGSLTMTLLNRGYRPGDWMYSIGRRANTWATPDDNDLLRRNNPRRRAAGAGLSRQQRIDAILDKINQKGYNSLTKEEKDWLQREGQ